MRSSVSFAGTAVTAKPLDESSPQRPTGRGLVEPVLYTCRVLLTGIHLTRTGEVEASLVRLNEEARLGHVADLIVRKLAGPEQSALGYVTFHRGEYERLRALLEDIHGASTLPEGLTARPALNELLVRIRPRSP